MGVLNVYAEFGLNRFGSKKVHNNARGVFAPQGRRGALYGVGHGDEEETSDRVLSNDTSFVKIGWLV